MSVRTPSLGALRVFLAVARHGSVSRAAEALHLTHGAVSHQLRGLQEELGIALVEKRGRGIVLSPVGRAYALRLDAAFAEIEAATQEAVAGRRPRLRVTTIPSFAARWLLPRLGDFISTCPDVDVEVQSTPHLADIKGGEADVALRFGSGRYPGLYSQLLMADWLFPVCTPEFAARHRLADGVGLDGVPLLHSDNEPWVWWLRAAGLPEDEPEAGPVFNDSSLMLASTATGLGLCLGRLSLAYDDLASGRLVRPYSAFVRSPNAYYFVCRKERAAQPALASFRTWIAGQLAGYPRLED